MVLPSGCTMCVGSGVMCRVTADSAALYEAEDKSKTCNPDIAKTYIERAIFPFWGGGPKNFFK